MWKQPNPCQEGGISNTEVGSVSEKDACENLCVGDAVMAIFLQVTLYKMK